MKPFAGKVVVSGSGIAGLKTAALIAVAGLQSRSFYTASLPASTRDQYTNPKKSFKKLNKFDQLRQSNAAKGLL